MRRYASLRSLPAFGLALALFVPGLASAQEAPPTSGSVAPSSAAAVRSTTAEAAVARRPSHREQFRAQARAPGSTRLLTSLLSSVGFGPELLWGGGLELRLDHYPTGLPFHTGAFIQSEVQTDGAVRIAAGMQGGAYFMGCQLGLTYRYESDRYWSTLGVQIGKSINFGIFSIGGRVVIPIAEFPSTSGQLPGALTSTGIEGAVFMSVGLPTNLEGERPSCGCPHGEEDAAADE